MRAILMAPRGHNLAACCASSMYVSSIVPLDECLFMSRESVRAWVGHRPEAHAQDVHKSRLMVISYFAIDLISRPFTIFMV